MENKRAIEGFENFLKRNATCNAEIVVFHENFCDEPLGIIVKQGELFVPPRLCRSSQFVPDVPDHYRYSLTENELITIELTNFSKVIHNLKMLMSGVGYSPQMPQLPAQASIPRIVNTKYEEKKQVEQKKREFKAMDKMLLKKAKVNIRANRDEDMNYFVVYYDAKHPGVPFKQLKQLKELPTRIFDMLQDITMTRKI